MTDVDLPAWLTHLEEEDHQFIKRFLLASGSLKELAEAYAVTYPTIRLRLDRLIERIRLLDDAAPRDAFDARLRILVSEGKLSPTLAKELLRTHRSIIRKEGGK